MPARNDGSEVGPPLNKSCFRPALGGLVPPGLPSRDVIGEALAREGGKRADRLAAQPERLVVAGQARGARVAKRKSAGEVSRRAGPASAGSSG